MTLKELCVKATLAEDMCSTKDRKYIDIAKGLLPELKVLYKKAKNCKDFKLKTKIHTKLQILKVKLY